MTEIEKYIFDWDNGLKVKSVCMCGKSLGKKYEIAIQHLMIEILRVGYKSAINYLGERYSFSGAQAGAANNIASVFLLKGIEISLNDLSKERIIFIRKDKKTGLILISKN